MDSPAPATPPHPRLPWDYHPALQPERLRLCARLLANARRDALALARAELGDDAWSVGCRAYAFGRQRLRRVAEAGAHTWLRVLDGTQHFVFLMCAVAALERSVERSELSTGISGVSRGHPTHRKGKPRKGP